MVDDVTRPGEYLVPKSYRLARCRSCQAVIVWTTTANNRLVPISMDTARTDAAGQRWALNHFVDCPHAGQHRSDKKPASPVARSDSRDGWTPITMTFPSGAIIPVAGHVRAHSPDGWLTLHFDHRDELYSCVLVTEFIRRIGRSVSHIYHADDLTRVVVV